MNNATYKNILSIVSVEIRYNLAFLIVLAIIFAGYSFISLFDIELLTLSPPNLDLWGGFIGFFFYLMLYIMWMIRVKEKRVLFHSLLPISQMAHAVSRMIHIMSIMTASFIYVTLQLFLIPSWSEQSGSMLAQLGFVFILFALFIIGRDLWFADPGKISRKYASLIFVESVIISLTAVIFIYVRPFLYDISGAFAGRFVFMIWAFVLIAVTPYTFAKRKQFLA